MNEEWKNHTPKGNPPVAKPLPADKPVIDITDTAALKGLAMTALVEIVQTAPRNVSLVSAIRELIDRIEGKAPQSIAITAKDERLERAPIDRIMHLLSLPVIENEPKS